MGTRRKPRCFVAMAFDHDETDALYDRAVRPVLKANGIIPVIINRRQDNRDINQQIIEQLEVCDFCITDLTYARPSVYFEAGYAQRATEVIYTVRADHLHKNQPDNLRVHFDLQMKPLIPWATPGDASFPRRLEQRMRNTVLRAWTNAQTKTDRERKARDTFAHMPLTKRLTTLRRRAVSRISTLGFSQWTPLLEHYWRPRSFSSRGILPRLGRLNWVISAQREKRLLHLASVRIEESLALTKLRDGFRSRFLSWRGPPHLDGDEMTEERSPVNRTIEHHLLGSIRPVPQARIMSAIPSLRWDPAALRYALETTWQYKGRRSRRGGRKAEPVEIQLSVSRAVYVYFIDGIQSLPQFRTRLGRIVEQMESNREETA